MVELTLRLIFSLAVVVGMLLLLARLASKRFASGADALVQVVHRQSLSRTASVSVVTVGSKVLVLGATDQQVTLLTELDPEELVDLDALAEGEEGAGPDGIARPASSLTGQRLFGAAAPASGLGGSLLSAATWRQAWSSLTNMNTGRKNQ